MKVWTLTHTHFYEEDGTTIVGVFSSEDKARDYIKTKFPEYEIDKSHKYDDGYSYTKTGDRYSDAEYLRLDEETIDKPTW